MWRDEKDEKSAKFRVWEKASDGSNLILEILESPYSLLNTTRDSLRELNLYTVNQLDPLCRIDTIATCDRQVDGHLATADATLYVY